MAAGGDAGRLVGKGQNAFQFVHRQGVQLLLAELGQSGPKEGVACAVGVAHLAGDASHMASFLPKAVEYAVCTQGDENQPDAVLCQLCRAAFAVSGAGEQGQLLIGHFQNIHQRKGCFHLSNGVLFVLPEVGTVIGVVGDGSTQLFGAGGSIQRSGAGGVGGQADRAKVDVSGMAVDADHPTTMAVVSVDATGERDFSFYRSANADVMLCKEDISDEALKAAKIVHFGSVSLTADPSRTATLDAAARAKKLGAVITYDPNYRANLWKNKEDAIAQMKAPLPLVDILKVSDEELPLLTGTTDCESGTAQLAQNGIRLIFVTLGANGVFYRFGEKTGHVAGVPCKVGDTNGAGDTFFGAALSKLCKEELDTLTVDKLEGILAFANKAASITTSRHGAIPAMPTLAEVEG